MKLGAGKKVFKLKTDSAFDLVAGPCVQLVGGLRAGLDRVHGRNLHVLQVNFASEKERNNNRLKQHFYSKQLSLGLAFGGLHYVAECLSRSIKY